MGKKEILALIPARGGSKRLPGKNIKELWGKPLIAYSIDTALKSRLINRVICTTDDQEIADIAIKYGAEVPILRPKELAKDSSATTEAYLHVLNWLFENEGYEPDIIVYLRPTNPLRSPGVVDDVIKTLISRPDVETIRTVSESPFHPYRFRMIEEKSKLIKPLVFVPREGPFKQAKQPFPKAVIVNGYLDATWVKVVLEKKISMGEKILPYILDEEIPIDIDTNEDWNKLITKFSSYEDYLEEKIED